MDSQSWFYSDFFLLKTWLFLSINVDQMVQPWIKTSIKLFLSCWKGNPNSTLKYLIFLGHQVTLNSHKKSSTRPPRNTMINKWQMYSLSLSPVRTKGKNLKQNASMPCVVCHWNSQHHWPTEASTLQKGRPYQKFEHRRHNKKLGDKGLMGRLERASHPY